MIIHQISIFVENQPGRLADIIGLVSQEANIRALSIADTSDFGILRLIVSDTDKAIAALKKQSITVAKTEVIAVALPDSPGGLYAVLDLLRCNGISVEYAYAFITRKNDDAYVILRVEDNAAAIDILQNNGMTLLKAADVNGL